MVLCQDNFFNSFDLMQYFNRKGIYCFGTIRRLVIQRYFSDHFNGIGVYIQPKHSRAHSLKCFTHGGNDHTARDKTHLMIHNSPGKNSVIFISNTNSMLGKSTVQGTSCFGICNFRMNFIRVFNKSGSNTD